MHHPSAVHPRHRPGQPHGQPNELITGQRRRQARQTGSAHIFQHDRARIAWSRQQLRDPDDTAQSLQHRHLVDQPPQRIRAQGLLTDHRAALQEQPSHPGAGALVQYLGPIGRISVRPHPSYPHPPAPPRAVGLTHRVAGLTHRVPTPTRGTRRLLRPESAVGSAVSVRVSTVVVRPEPPRARAVAFCNPRPAASVAMTR